jgi:hypothetical protein
MDYFNRFSPTSSGIFGIPKPTRLFTDQALYEKRSSTAKGLLLGVCFVAEDPKGREHLRQILSEAAPKLSPIELRHGDRSQDEGVNRLKDEVT